MTNAMTRHSDAEMLAAFVDGHLDGEQLQEVTAHLAACEECRGVIGEAVAFEREDEARQSPRSKWLALAAAIVVVVAAFPFVRAYLDQREIRKDVHELYAVQKERVLAGRYSGEEFHGAYSPKRGGGTTEEDNENLDAFQVSSATSKLREDTKHDASPAGLRARALAEATDKEWAAALQTINRIPENARDAATWNDIAVILFANNKTDDALAAADRALKLQPNMPEALFTRWAILRDAESARQYLAVDSSSKWADEIRSKMKLLQ